MPARVWGQLYLLSVIWGASFLFTRVAVAEVPPFTIVLVRMGLAAIFLVAAARFMGHSLPRDGRMWRHLTIMGLLNGVMPFVLIVWAQTRIDAGLAAILNATTPVFGVIFAHFLTDDEKATPGKILGVLLGLAGVAVLIGVDALKQAGALLPQLAMIGASMCYALSALWSRRFRGMAPVVIASGQIGSGALIMLPLALAVDHPWALAMPSMGAIAAMVASALISTGLAYILFYRIVAVAGGSNTTLVTLLIPVNAVILAAIFFGEQVTANRFLGMAIIGLAFLAIDGRILRWLRRRLQN